MLPVIMVGGKGETMVNLTLFLKDHILLTKTSHMATSNKGAGKCNSIIYQKGERGMFSKNGY
jgi:hypothetical protein